MTTVRRSLAYSAADSYVSAAVYLASTVVISRLLSPEQIGVYAVAAAFAAFAATFRDFGVAEYLIQEKDLARDKIRAALTVNIAVSWLMGLLMLAGSQPAADFYGTPGIAEVMQLLAINFALIPFGAVTMAYFRRQLDFRPIFFVGFAGNLTHLAVAIYCAFNGFGYMSLAWASLANTFIVVAGSMLLRPADFPIWPGLKAVREVFRFGKHASGIYIVGQLGKSAPDVVIGRALDMASVAFFSRANGLIEIFHKTVLRAIYPVCLPYFAHSRRHNQGIACGYLKATGFLTAIGWPFFAFMAIIAPDAVRLIYGHQWTASVPLARILCLVAFFEIVHYLATEALIAAGRVALSNLLQFMLQSLRVVGLLAVIPFGLPGACWGLVLAAGSGLLLAQVMLKHAIDLQWSDIIKECLPNLAITAATSLSTGLTYYLFGLVSVDEYLFRLMVGCLVFCLIWLLAVRKLAPSLWQEINTLANRLFPFLRRH
ncbi:MAG: lipopolysaccharide biosynthesis protein [Pseudomonadota bacterium]